MAKIIVIENELNKEMIETLRYKLRGIDAGISTFDIVHTILDMKDALDKVDFKNLRIWPNPPKIKSKVPIHVQLMNEKERRARWRR